MTRRVTAVTGVIRVRVLVINYVVKAVFSRANSRLIFKWSNLALQATDFAGCGCSACLEIIMWFSTRVISTPEQEFNIVKSSLFYRRETQYDCFSFVISYWKQPDLSMSASMSRNLKIAWFFPCIFLFYLPVDSTTHVDLSLILNSMLDSIKTKKYFCEQENGRQRAFVPVLDPSRPVWVCSNRWPSRFRLTFTRLARIHDGRTRNTDGAQPY